MDKLNWCFKQKKGIKIIEPNEIISKNYLSRAKNDLENISKQDKIWKVIFSYYICYNSIYAVLMRYGIKSEIHSCSIELLKLFENLKTFRDFLKGLKEQRTNVQYYLKEPKDVDTNKVRDFLEACELEIYEINNDKINELKNILNEYVC